MDEFILFEGDFLPMETMNISAVENTAMETAATTSAPKLKWRSKGAKCAKKATKGEHTATNHISCAYRYSSSLWSQDVVACMNIHCRMHPA